jgi:hypothetical protein
MLLCGDLAVGFLKKQETCIPAYLLIQTLLLTLLTVMAQKYEALARKLWTISRRMWIEENFHKKRKDFSSQLGVLFFSSGLFEPFHVHTSYLSSEVSGKSWPKCKRTE